MDIQQQLEKYFKAQFSDMATEAKPVTLDDIEQMNQAKADYYAGKEPQSNHAAYLEAYSVESSLHIIRGLK